MSKDGHASKAKPLVALCHRPGNRPKTFVAHEEHMPEILWHVNMHGTHQATCSQSASSHRGNGGGLALHTFLFGRSVGDFGDFRLPNSRDHCAGLTRTRRGFSSLADRAARACLACCRSSTLLPIGRSFSRRRRERKMAGAAIKGLTSSPTALMMLGSGLLLGDYYDRKYLLSRDLHDVAQFARTSARSGWLSFGLVSTDRVRMAQSRDGHEKVWDDRRLFGGAVRQIC